MDLLFPSVRNPQLVHPVVDRLLRLVEGPLQIGQVVLLAVVVGYVVPQMLAAVVADIVQRALHQGQHVLRRLLVEHGGFHYDRDALNDELPYWVTIAGLPHLVIPYSYETNDNRCDQSNGFAQADDFFQYMRDAFNILYEEGEDRPAVLSIGLHDRLIGRPARAVGLIKLLDQLHRNCTGNLSGSAGMPSIITHHRTISVVIGIIEILR